MRLTVGVHNRTGNEPSATRRKIKRIVPHPVYINDVNYNKSYDFALIELETPLVYNDKIAPICFDDSVFPPGTECYVTGWGQMTSKNDVFYNSNINISLPRDSMQSAVMP